MATTKRRRTTAAQQRATGAVEVVEGSDPEHVHSDQAVPDLPQPLVLMTDELQRAREVADQAKEAYLKAKAEVRSLEDVIIGMENRYQIPLDLRQPIKKITRVRKGKDGEGTTIPVK